MPRPSTSSTSRSAGNGFDLAGVAATIATRQKRNFETIVAANQALASSMQAIAAEQYGLLRDCVDDAADTLRDAVAADSALSLARLQATLARRAIAHATQHASECAEIAARSTREVTALWSERLNGR